jgi:glutamine phosphoribosylpyrophosphate amidotransferase
VPNALINKDVREGRGTKKKLEKDWEKSKKDAEKSHPDNKWALTNYIYQNRRDASVLDDVEVSAARRLLGK